MSNPFSHTVFERRVASRSTELGRAVHELQDLEDRLEAAVQEAENQKLNKVSKKRSAFPFTGRRKAHDKFTSSLETIIDHEPDDASRRYLPLDSSSAANAQKGEFGVGAIVQWGCNAFRFIVSRVKGSRK